MCVIIDKNPRVEIPFEKLRAACQNNPHGFGIMTEDRGKVEIFRHFSNDGNDAEFIMREMEKRKDLRLALHLRYRTHGKSDITNCHPYDVFEVEKTQREYQLYMMHNGVLSEYTKDSHTTGRSDSFLFATGLVRPLLENSLQTVNDLDAMLSPDVRAAIDKAGGAGNKLLFLDNRGNWFRTSEAGWSKFDGWAASNSWYFADDRRTKAQNTYRTPRRGGQVDLDAWHRNHRGNNYTRYERGETLFQDNDLWPVKRTVVAPTPRTTAGEHKALNRIKKANGGTKNAATHVWEDRAMAETFCQQMGITSLEEITCFNQTDFEQMVADYPDLAVKLIQDLVKTAFGDTENV